MSSSRALSAAAIVLMLLGGCSGEKPFTGDWELDTEKTRDSLMNKGMRPTNVETALGMMQQIYGALTVEDDRFELFVVNEEVHCDIGEMAEGSEFTSVDCRDASGNSLGEMEIGREAEYLVLRTSPEQAPVYFHSL